MPLIRALTDVAQVGQMRDGTLGKTGMAAAIASRWRQMLAAGLLMLAALLFAAVAWAYDVALPSWLWLALLLAACLALVTGGEAGRAETAAAALPGQRDSAQPQATNIILATATHELRTPLNAIVGFAELLRNAEIVGASRKQREDFSQAILDNARQLQQRLGDMLDANRLSAGALSLAEQPCDMAEIIEVVSRERQGAASVRDVTIIARVASGITCSGDAARLRQALACVVDNAIAFSPPGGIVNINMLRGSAGQLAVTVTDAGPGIAASDVARAFEPFRQVDEGSARHHGGLGLGLFIARSIMRLHGGDVTLIPVPGTGTDVRLTLPGSRVNWAATQEYPATVAAAHVA